MIVVHIDTTSDGHDLTHCYEGIKDVKVLVNPTKAEVIETLKKYPNETLMGLGHGSGSGLFGADFGYAIDGTMIDYLKDREMIGIWCHASDFARHYNGVKGFFTSMFISNPSEASWFGKKDAINEEITHSENIFFSDRVNDLIKRNVPLDEWVEILNTEYHNNLDFSVYNMNGLEYFKGDGNSKTILGEYKAYEDEDEDIDVSGFNFDADTIERGMDDITYDLGEKADDITYYLDELEGKFEDGADEIEYNGNVISKETIKRWRDCIEEISNFTYGL